MEVSVVYHQTLPEDENWAALLLRFRTHHDPMVAPRNDSGLGRVLRVQVYDGGAESTLAAGEWPYPPELVAEAADDTAGPDLVRGRVIAAG